MMIAWAQREGWNPGAADARCFRAADPDGFLVGTIDDRLVATISAVRYPGLGFVGLYIVDPEYRGRGYGLRIWTAAMERLEGVGDRTRRRRRPAGQLRAVRLRPRAPHHPVRRARTRARARRRRGAVRRRPRRRWPTTTSPASARPDAAFLEQWLAQPGALALGVRIGGTPVRLRRHPPGARRVQGRPAVRRRRRDRGADPRRTCRCTPATARPCSSTCPSPTPQASPWPVTRGLEPVFETARMYRGGSPALPLGSAIFGITSFELPRAGRGARGGAERVHRRGRVGWTSDHGVRARRHRG